MMLASSVPCPSVSTFVYPPETKSRPGTRAPLKSLILALIPVSTTATITCRLPLVRFHACDMLTFACGHWRVQLSSLGLNAHAEPAVASKPTAKNRRTTRFLKPVILRDVSADRRRGGCTCPFG